MKSDCCWILIKNGLFLGSLGSLCLYIFDPVPQVIFVEGSLAFFGLRWVSNSDVFIQTQYKVRQLGAVPERTALCDASYMQKQIALRGNKKAFVL